MVLLLEKAILGPKNGEPFLFMLRKAHAGIERWASAGHVGFVRRDQATLDDLLAGSRMVASQ
jgi:hypothetical protein